MAIDNSISTLIACVSGIYFFYLSYGISQEKIFKFRDENGGRFTSTAFLLCIQCFTNALIAFLATFIWKPKNNSIPLIPFAFTASTYLGAMLCSNEALKHINYPTQALGKSCKMIPVMLMGVLLRGRRYSIKEYCCVFLITIGIAVFQLGKANTKKMEQENSFYGLGLLFLSLTLDGITGPKQEEISSIYQPSVHQQMFKTNIWAFFYTFTYCLLTGSGIEGLTYCLTNPGILQWMLLFCICSACGQNFIFLTIQQFSALTCTTITTTRKFFTILCSVLLFGNELSTQSWIGVAIVFSGLGWELSNKYSKHQAKLQAQKKKI